MLYSSYLPTVSIKIKKTDMFSDGSLNRALMRKKVPVVRYFY